MELRVRHIRHNVQHNVTFPNLLKEFTIHLYKRKKNNRFIVQIENRASKETKPNWKTKEYSLAFCYVQILKKPIYMYTYLASS